MYICQWLSLQTSNTNSSVGLGDNHLIWTPDYDGGQERNNSHNTYAIAALKLHQSAGRDSALREFYVYTAKQYFVLSFGFANKNALEILCYCTIGMVFSRNNDIYKCHNWINNNAYKI